MPPSDAHMLASTSEFVKICTAVDTAVQQQNKQKGCQNEKLPKKGYRADFPSIQKNMHVECSNRSLCKGVLAFTVSNMIVLVGETTVIILLK